MNIKKTTCQIYDVCKARCQNINKSNQMQQKMSWNFLSWKKKFILYSQIYIKLYILQCQSYITYRKGIKNHIIWVLISKKYHLFTFEAKSQIVSSFFKMRQKDIDLNHDFYVVVGK